MLRGAGDPFFDKFLDLEIYQVSTIVKFVFYQKGWESPIHLETPKIKNKHRQVNGCSKIFFALVGC